MEYLYTVNQHANRFNRPEQIVYVGVDSKKEGEDLILAIREGFRNYACDMGLLPTEPEVSLEYNDDHGKDEYPYFVAFIFVRTRNGVFIVTQYLPYVVFKGLSILEPPPDHALPSAEEQQQPVG
jgi:hypothetical protein